MTWVFLDVIYILYLLLPKLPYLLHIRSTARPGWRSFCYQDTKQMIDNMPGIPQSSNIQKKVQKNKENSSFLNFVKLHKLCSSILNFGKHCYAVVCFLWYTYHAISRNFYFKNQEIFVELELISPLFLAHCAFQAWQYSHHP